MQSNTLDASVYTDFQGLGQLKADAARQTESSLHQAAQQFEALFIQSMLKSMRSASPGDPLVNSDQVKLYQDMMDKQLSIEMAENGGIGIAAIIEQQLGGSQDSEQTDRSANTTFERSIAFATQLWQSSTSDAKAKPQAADSNGVTGVTQSRALWDSPESFVQSLLPAARRAAKALGTEPEAVIAVVALETGWGKHVIPGSNGLSSHNLFGIKSTDPESENRVSVTTLEFQQGALQKVQQPFRTYSSPGAAVADFANFINENPRYGEALKKADDPETFLQEIHKAGYATDPDYTGKVVAVMRQIQRMTQGSIAVADNSPQKTRI